MNNALILDCETLTSNKGNPFDITNKLVCVGVKWLMNGSDWKPTIFYDDFSSLQEIINRASIIVGFNLKFDLHWLRRIGIDISKIRVWDCQLAEFILNNQKTPYPSLDDTAEKYGFQKKLDIIKGMFWGKGIDTNEIPRDILSSYLTQDLILTQQVFEKQMDQFQTDARAPLFRLQCADLLTLEEMEWNGIYFNTEKAIEKTKGIEKELDEITQELLKFTNGVPINLNSNNHVSCLLYGGTIMEDIRIPIGIYKTGEKIGQLRYKIITKEYPLPRLIEPLKGTETENSKKKGGVASYWEVNDNVLRRLKLNKEAKALVLLLKKYSELEKLKGTYLLGYTKLIKEMNWKHNMLHGTLNQCVAITGRLSSNKPNLQNCDPTTKLFMISRY